VFVGVVPEAVTAVEPEAPPRVELRIPADSAYVSVLRTATAGLAARLDFTLDDIDDLRMAVDEACGLLLPQAEPDSELTCEFTLASEELRISVTASSAAPRLPDREGFAWAVLSAVAGAVEASTGPGRDVTILIVRKRQASR
jgi:serine/threonine-protein kinase RsbW